MNITLDYATLIFARRELVNSMLKLNSIESAQAQVGVQYSVDVLTNIIENISNYKPKYTVQKEELSSEDSSQQEETLIQNKEEATNNEM